MIPVDEVAPFALRTKEAPARLRVFHPVSLVGPSCSPRPYRHRQTLVVFSPRIRTPGVFVPEAKNLPPVRSALPPSARADYLHWPTPVGSPSVRSALTISAADPSGRPAAAIAPGNPARPRRASLPPRPACSPVKAPLETRPGDRSFAAGLVWLEDSLATRRPLPPSRPVNTG